MADKDDQLQRFGKYLILDHLVDGGMAKICRARFLGEQADKIVAIKMVQPQYSQDPSFKKMFMDEIKVTFALNHPNIAQTYDYGLINDQLYTAMEYVDGKNLKQFLDALKNRKYVFPIEISTFITSQVCQALSYAHNFTDKLTGKSLNIIHRDISPHNIMLTYDGAVKVIDFGIAKAATNSEETKAGTIKGKLAYLAPEYLDGLELDARYDQFAVGITFWEMLCSRRLFNANNELATIKKIHTCNVPAPSSINPNVPKELDLIVLKALSKDRNLRYENMDQFNRALVKFLYSNYPDFNATDLNYFAQELFKEDITSDQAKMREFGKIDISTHIKDLKNEQEGGTNTSQASSQEPTPKIVEEKGPAARASSTKIIDLGMEGSKKIKKKRGDEEKSQAEAFGGAALKLDVNKKKDSSAKFKRPVGRTKENKSATRIADSSHTGTSYSPRKKSKSKGALLFKVFLGIILIFGLFKFINIFFKKEEETKVVENNIEQKMVEEKKVITTRKIRLINTNPFQKFYLNGTLVPYSSSGITFNIGKNKLRVEQEGKLPQMLSIDVTASGPRKIDIPNPETGVFGALVTVEAYDPGSYLVYYYQNFEFKVTLPITDLKLPVGQYKGYIYNSFNDTKKQVQFEINENIVTRLDQ